MRLVRAGGDEDFVTVAAGEEVVEHPDSGEVVWRQGSHLPRWNWHQGPCTRLTERTVSGIFLLESLSPMSITEVEQAATELAEPLQKFSPNAQPEVHPPNT
jgi:DNA/RNA-binding domain of Phe-tRNA-synthetase-like protein